MAPPAEVAMVRCTRSGCARRFEVPLASLGRNVRCPRCGFTVSAVPADPLLEPRAGGEREGRGPGLVVPLEGLLDSIRSQWNVGSMFRSADATGVRHLHLAGITARPPKSGLSKTALGAELVVPWSHVKDARERAEQLARAGVRLAALERTPRSVSLLELRLEDLRPPVCLVAGNEVAGVSAPLLDLAPLHVAIPMRGAKGSLNVAVAFGIACFHVAHLLAQAGLARPAGRHA